MRILQIDRKDNEGVWSVTAEDGRLFSAPLSTFPDEGAVVDALWKEDFQSFRLVSEPTNEEKEKEIARYFEEEFLDDQYQNGMPNYYHPDVTDRLRRESANDLNKLGMFMNPYGFCYRLDIMRQLFPRNIVRVGGNDWMVTALTEEFVDLRLTSENLVVNIRATIPQHSDVIERHGNDCIELRRDFLDAFTKRK
jgi:hypothetical protein